MMSDSDSDRENYNDAGTTPSSEHMAESYLDHEDHGEGKQLLPTNFQYYNSHLNKMQFNLILVLCATKLLNLLYANLDEEKLKLRFFIIEVLRRSRTSIQSLQIACYYMMKLVKRDASRELPSCPKKLFLGLVIIASKFNQDSNYTFRTWLKICGCSRTVGQERDLESVNHSDFSMQELRSLEMQCLKLLNFDCYINGKRYENWCNILCIFGYDFIKEHRLCSNEIVWETDSLAISTCLLKWARFINRLSVGNLSVVNIKFQDYYVRQLGKKVLFSDIKQVPSLFGNKRTLVEDPYMAEKSVKVACR